MIPGKYQAEVTSAEFRFSSTGTPGLRVFFRLVDSPDETIHGDIWLSPKAIKGARTQLKALGYNAEKQSLQDIAENADLLTGATTVIEVANEEYNGKTSLKVKRIGGGEKPDAMQLADLDKLLRNAKGGDAEEDIEPPF